MDLRSGALSLLVFGRHDPFGFAPGDNFRPNTLVWMMPAWCNVRSGGMGTDVTSQILEDERESSVER